ncbi:hypothetical protein [Frisingicoccus sp.]|uniref:hypothetical protein n=1 Tax=Frisingicoccus sp. TaxID=1918627 RepID=UPI003AB6B8EE
MKILIDDIKLNLLLEQKKQFIGRKVAWDSVLSAFSFLISVLLASYSDFLGISGTVFKTVFVLLGIGFSAKSIFDIVKSSKNNYNFTDLLKDINKLNEIVHGHSIVVIKDTFNRFSNRFLVYEDNRWNCNFFVNYKDNPNNEAFIINHISSELKIEVDDIKLSFIAQKIHEKYSETAKERKVYSHKFYLATISNFPEDMEKDSFEFDGRLYHWKSIAELERNKDVQRKNLDILNYIKELF